MTFGMNYVHSKSLQIIWNDSQWHEHRAAIIWKRHQFDHFANLIYADFVQIMRYHLFFFRWFTSVSLAPNVLWCIRKRSNGSWKYPFIKKRRNQYVKWTNRFISIPSFYDVWTINVRNQFKFTRRHILNQKFSSMPTWRKMAIFEQKSEIFKLFQFNWKICLWRVLLATKMAHGKKEVEISWL